MKLRDCMIVEQHHAVIDHLGHEVIGLHLAIERRLRAIGDPEITWAMHSAEPGFLRAIIGKRRDVLVISHSRLREYLVLIACRPHGTVLHTAWIALVVPRLANDLRRAVRPDVEAGSRFDVGSELDVFDALDLHAYFAITRLALKDAIHELADREIEAYDESVDAE
jgi:hypothetical protein